MKASSLADSARGKLAVVAALTVPFALALALALAGCAREKPTVWQGYLEAEFVYVSSPLAGRVEHLTVQKGQRVLPGAPLFTLEHAAEKAAEREAASRVRAAQARLADLKKGSRPTELAALEARLEQARAAAELSQRELTRQRDLFDSGSISSSEFDRARLTHEANRRVLDELTAQIATARLGARTDAIAAAEAEVAAAQAALAHATWAITEKSQTAPRAALVHDTLLREGELAAAGAPVVQLLPAENLKIRFFVPEPALARVPLGARVRVSLSGRPEPVDARVIFVSPKPEYTPPVLYNRDNRAKLVFLIEAALDPAVARELHPGQPVEVTPTSPAPSAAQP